ncbi:MAG: hypothetical protein ACHQRO_12130, partial [Vicinamibacteria bacterium]
MKILFAALHLAYYRNFESVVRALAEGGHQVHLTADEPENLGGRELAERLAAEYATVTWGQLPSLEHEPWFDAARRMRESLDYVRVLDASYPDKLRFRTEERAARLVRGGTRVPGGAWLALRALKAFERALPVSQAIRDYLERERPDVVVLTSLTYSRSQQLDVLRAARSLGIPVAAAIMSWDHLSSKALLHVAPDLVIVWNEVQRQEAVEMHGLRAERIVVTGAQCYDQWFARTPDRDRETFCGAVGLRPDRPFVLWVHSALSPTPVPPEPVLVQRWIEALRASADPRLRDVGVLVRGHPERMKEWAGIDLTGYGNVAFSGGNPIDAERKQDYFDSLFYSSAVVGLVTTAFVEAAVVGRPVLTITLPEYRRHQEEMIHFRYLRTVAGGLLHSAPDLAGHLAQLADAIGTTGRDERNLRFVNAFVRPAGLDVPATPAFVAALEGASSLAAPAPVRAPWYQAAVVTVASWSGTAAGRWLMNDKRADAYDEHRDERERAVRTRVEAKSRWHAGKVRRNQWRGRRDAVVGAWKAVKRAGRLARHRAAVSV